MWTKTRLTELLGVELPIIQAPMAGGATTPELVAAVANAGALGSIGAGYMTPHALEKVIKDVRKLTPNPFAVNLFVPEDHQASRTQMKAMQKRVEQISHELNVNLTAIEPPYAQSFAEQIEVVMEAKVAIFSFTFGILSQQWLKQLQQNQIVTVGTATSLVEAERLQQAGVDVVVAQGVEAGGHRGSFVDAAEKSLLGNFALLPQLADAIDLPIVAAGGIMDARGVVAALALGATGVQLGTAFLTCPESGIHPKYKQRLLNEKQDNTVLTRAFSGRLARGINNKFIQDMANFERQCLDYPIQNALTRPMRQAAAKQNNTDFMSLWAGQSAYLSKAIPADQLVSNLKKEVDQLLQEIV